MKGLIAWTVGVALTALSVVTPAVIADENGEVHYWTSSTSYVPSEENMMVAMPASSHHVYLVNDDPSYDLSGPGDHWFLIGDGTAVHENSWQNSTAVLVSTGGGGMEHEVVPITAEYRQDWLAVAAGDRPVRSFVAPRSVTGTGVVETNMNNMASTTEEDHFRPVVAQAHHVTHHRHYTYRTMHRRTHVAATYYHRAEPASYAVNEPAMNENVAAGPSVEVQQDQMGHELFQMGSVWYMKDNKDWFRAESWRGPFVHVHKGMVPREVRMSEKHPSRNED
jgi:hypothetical protein